MKVRTGPNLEGGKRGRESSLSTKQSQSISIVEESVVAAMNAIPAEHRNLLLSVLVPHGRTGGVFEQFSDLVANSRKQAHNYMLTSIKEERWNGLDMEGGVPQITPRPTSADEDENTEGEG